MEYVVIYFQIEKAPEPTTSCICFTIILLCSENILTKWTKCLGLNVGARILRRGRQIGTKNINLLITVMLC